MKTNFKFLSLLFVALFTITACTNDDNDDEEEVILVEPTLEDVEVGLNNNEIGVMGRDLHFNASVLAGDKIDMVSIKIQPKSGETYVSDWSYERKWDEYKGIKNATVHKHFDIPENAVEGIYDFIIIVEDENGTTLEEVRTITIYLAENLPVDPQVGTIIVGNLETDRYAHISYFGEVQNGTDGLLIMNETAVAQGSITGVKGDGKLYVVLINKKHNHKPESIDAIDYSKTIVWNIAEHIDKATTGNFSNTFSDFTATPFVIIYPEFTIGAAYDNNLPKPNPIDGLKAWEAGDYYLGFLYENTTYKMGLFKYIEVSLVLQ
ncbi:DUF4625 domain-containing protein [Maribacter cobaltidurans]|uniref:Uncharacterized protein n=1 Tax=Maribacter cobaltidurans TaxID=1178778 RepID=A0A223V5N8_9FLAO|nr:DUF4625 domain-containing protein [Maribacter cobaltidurans]ASV30744.1 hypothetical protein CJ263_11240 [Maribacter cobaltidurans]GGD81436.1 hypothetical protein GCM10011412_18940 [Maribacter cobaltidurans]